MRAIVTTRERSTTGALHSPVKEGTLSFTSNNAPCRTPSAVYDNTSNVYGVSPINLSSKVTHDCVTPSYVARSRAGEVIVNDFKSVEEFIDAPQGVIDATKTVTKWCSSCMCYHTYVREHYWGTPTFEQFAGSQNWDPGSLADSKEDTLAERAITAAYAKLSDTDFLGLVSIAELHKTARTVRNLYGSILWWLQKGMSIKKKLKRGAIDAAQAASLWMEVRFGLRPLFYEIQSLATTLGSLNDVDQRVRIVASVDDIEEGTSFKWKNTLLATAELRKDSHHSLTAVAGLIVQPTLYGLSKPRGNKWGEENLTESAWELIPFSWLIDYLFNTGNFFAALNPNLRFDVLGSWVSVTELQEVQWSVNSISAIEGDTKYDVSYQDLRERRAKRIHTRYAHPSLPAHPHINVRLDWAKMLDILALVKCIDFSGWRI